MNHPQNFSRRDFLRTSATLALGVGALAAAPPARAALFGPRWPVTVRDAHLKATGDSNCWSAMQALGVDGLEVQVDENLVCPALQHPDRKYSLATEDDLKRLRDDFAKYNGKITAFCMANRLDERLEQEVEWTRKLAKAAEQLKVTAIRIDLVPHNVGIGEYPQFAIKACKQLCDALAGTAVRLGIENHGRLTNYPIVLDRIFNGVNSPKLGLTLDVANLYWFGHPLDEICGIVEKFASRVFHTHCKSIAYPEEKRNIRRAFGWEYAKYAAPLYEGDLDYARVVQILRKAGYEGDLCLENECLGRFPKEQHLEVLKKEVAFLKKLAK
ncbi:MAG: sugar phosphate isomerase/epimerase [Verrucomicrobia bacterium]|nr:sugar phosphate isomerase/epimerase [Verrucomicrobiota bacterium]